MQSDQHHEDDAGRAEVAETGEIVGPVGVDDGRGGRKGQRNLMMIDDQRLEPQSRSLRQGGMAARPAIDRDQQACIGRGDHADGFEAGPIAFGQTIRDVDQRVKPGGPQIFTEQSGRGRSIHVIITEDGDLLPGFDGARQPLHGRSHIGQSVRVRHERPQRRIEIGRAGADVDTAARQDARHDVRKALRLRHGQGIA